MYALIALLGLIVGSFLTVVVHRLAAGGTIIRGRSRCVHCQRQLSWFELVPVLSFMAQGGHCRSCRGSIPPSYPLIEAATAFSFIIIAAGIREDILPVPQFVSGTGATSVVLTFLYYAYFAASAVSIAAYDIRHRLIPQALSLPLVTVGVAALALGGAISRDFTTAAWTLATAVAAFGVFWSLWYFSKGRAMGRGDADVACAITLYLGPRLTLIALPIAFWLGALYGILLLGCGRLHWKSAIPFAPFLFAGALGALFGIHWIPLEYFLII